MRHMPEFGHHISWLRPFEDKLQAGGLNDAERADAISTCEHVLRQNPASEMAASILGKLRGVMTTVSAPVARTEAYEPLIDRIERPDVLRRLYDAGINGIATSMPAPAANEHPALISIRKLLHFRRNGAGWAELQGNGIIALEPGQRDNAWMIVLEDTHPINRAQAELMAVDTRSSINHLKIKPSAISQEWAGIAQLHELRHLHDFATGIEPKRPNRQQYLAGEVRAFSDEITAATLVSGGRLPGALDTIIAKHGLATVERAAALGNDLPKLMEIARELDPCITPQLPLSKHESGVRLAFYVFALAFRIGDNAGGDQYAKRMTTVERIYNARGVLPKA